MRRKLFVYAFAVLLSIGHVYGVEQDFDDGSVAVEDVEDTNESGEVIVEDVEEELVYESPKIEKDQFYFADHFDDAAESSKLWVKSQAKKDDIAEEIAKYDGLWSFEAPNRITWKNDNGLVLKSKAKHSAISAPLNRIFKFEDKPLVVQYEVTMQDGQQCGGSYIKLLSAGKQKLDLTHFNDKTPYTIMFGPDKCGNDIKMHFIFRHVNPINGSISEKHCRKPKERLEEPFKDKLPHLYQLVINPDNTFEIRVDHKTINEGSLLNDFVPPVNPPKEIDDPEDKKPEDWDEREKIPDPDSTKPEDWDEEAPPQIPDPSAAKPDGWLDDEPEMIPDPNAKKPEDWDVEIDGEWEAPLIDNPVCEKAVGCGEWRAPLVQNPEFKGKWRAPMIENPNYQGKWTARKIPNPDFFEDLVPFKMTPISAIGIELWSMSADILFDNLIITDSVEVANEYAARTYDLKRKYIDKESETFLNKVIQYTNQNPWLWGVYIVVVGTPLTFAIYSLFCTSKETESMADRKKDDGPTPDDPATGGSGDGQDGAKGASPKPKLKKSDLDVKVPTPTPDDEKSSEEEEIELEDVEDKAEELKSQTSDGARKRKPRKE